MAYKHPPLDPNALLIGSDGKTTPYFSKLWQDLGRELNAVKEIAKESAKVGVANLFMASDGVAVNFGGFYTNTPSRVEFDTSNLPILAAGEIYITQAVNLTKNGYTPYIKKATVGAVPVTQNSGAGSFDALFGGFTSAKPIADDAFNQIYNYSFDCEIDRESTYFDGLDWQSVFSGSVELYINSGAGQELIKMVPIVEYTSTPTLPDPTIVVTRTEPVLFTGAIGLVAGHEFGIKAVSGVINALNNVSYQTQSYSSITAITSPQIKSWVYN